MIVRVLIYVVTCGLLVHGACKFQSNDTNDQRLQDKIKKWSIYEKNSLTAKSGSSTYRIGICADIDGTAGKAGIYQEENNAFTSLGTIENANLIGTDTWIFLTYGNGTKYINECDNKTRSASIMFICGQDSPNTIVLREHTSKVPQCDYAFQIQVPELCPKVSKSLGGGAIFLIILASLASVYLIGGFLFMRLVRGARGIDQIPNRDLWRKLGNLSADGCDFCCRCNAGAPRAGYFLDESGPDLRGDDDILSP